MSKLGRNDQCRCGSGKKYKKCCLDKDETESKTKREEEMKAARRSDAERNGAKKREKTYGVSPCAVPRRRDAGSLSCPKNINFFKEDL